MNIAGVIKGDTRNLDYSSYKIFPIVVCLVFFLKGRGSRPSRPPLKFAGCS